MPAKKLCAMSKTTQPLDFSGTCTGYIIIYLKNVNTPTLTTSPNLPFPFMFSCVKIVNFHKNKCMLFTRSSLYGQRVSHVLFPTSSNKPFLCLCMNDSDLSYNLLTIIGEGSNQGMNVCITRALQGHTYQVQIENREASWHRRCCPHIQSTLGECQQVLMGADGIDGILMAQS